ncbi:MAG: hypothetical protein HY564_02640, partial [Candidatus Jacksonbacteria bacterium]|nr:hypothetical protein [Candidatus Jacksonbacteria bacterium]
GGITGNTAMMDRADALVRGATVDVIADAGATFIPFVPAGTTRAIRAADKGRDAGRVVKSVDNVSDTIKLLGARRDNLLQGVENGKLRNFIGDIFKQHKPGEKIIGDGGAIDAFRHTLKTGEKIGGTDHATKIKEIFTGLNKLLQNGNLSSGDRQKTEWLVNNIQDALKGGVGK